MENGSLPRVYVTHFYILKTIKNNFSFWTWGKKWSKFILNQGHTYAQVYFNSGQFLYLQSLIYVYLLNISKACLGAGGMLHFGVADWVGQYPVVSTRTVRSTPPKDTCMKDKKDVSLKLTRICFPFHIETALELSKYSAPCPISNK